MEFKSSICVGLGLVDCSVKLDNLGVLKYLITRRSRSSEEAEVDNFQRAEESVEIYFCPLHV